MSVFFRVEDAIEVAGGLSVSDHAVSSDTSRLKGRVPSGVLSWLEGLLRERFNENLILSMPQPKQYELSLAGHPKAIRIDCHYEIFDQSNKEIPCGYWQPPDTTWLAPGIERLPMPGVTEPPGEVLECRSDGCLLRYDVLGLAYWMLSRREEVGRTDLDANQRFPAEASHAFRHGYLKRPIVDEWFQVLRQAIHTTWPGLKLHQPKYSIQLSHDVDTPARYALVSALGLARNMAIDLVRDRDRNRQALKQAPWIWAGSRRRLHAADPFNTFDWIMNRSAENGLRNTFFFICGHTDRKRDGTYTPDHPAVVELMRRMHDQGHEVGLHPSYHTYLDPTALSREAESLRCARERAGIPEGPIGARMHYLRWKTPDTLHALTKAGIAYDTTLGYARHPGFRCGTCHEYQAFDPVRGEAVPIRLRPLIVMEATIIQGMHANEVGDAEMRMAELMAACRRVNGNFTLLWHNTMLEHAHQRLLYERVLDCHQELIS